MAHFAELDKNNKVIRVIVVSNSNCMKDSVKVEYPELATVIKNVYGGAVGDVEWESEAVGIAFCEKLFGSKGKWVQTSYHGNIRRRYAGIGDTYDPDRDAFITPQEILGISE